MITSSIVQDIVTPIKWDLLSNYLTDVLIDGFEDLGAGGADVFANWSEGTFGTGVVSAETTEVKFGTYSCKLFGGATAAVARVFTPIVIGDNYRARFWAKANANGKELRVWFGNDASTKINQSLTTDWVQYEITSQCLGEAIFHLRLDTINTEIYLDNVELYKLN